MRSTREFAIRYLKAVEKKNEGYFIANDVKILDCVDISGLESVTVNVKDVILPEIIVRDIEMFF